MTNASPAPMHERTHSVSTAPALDGQDSRRPVPAPAPRTVTAEDVAKARKAIADLERIERLVTTVLVVLGIGGLIFTAVNVTLFATEHHVHWAIAWMLDPLVSISLLAALFIDGKLSAHGYRPGGWPFALRWFAGLSTWLMNCWGSLYPDVKFTGWPDHPDPAGLLLHSVIPFLVIFLAEAGSGYRKFSVRKRAEHEGVLAAWKDQEETRTRAEAEDRRRRTEEQRETAEAERKRAADLVAERERTDLETRKARGLAEAEALKIRAAEEAEARRVKRDREETEARLAREREAEARNESAVEARSRRDAETREQQARLDRENAEHTAELERLRLLAEAEAEAVKTRADAEARAAEKARDERRRAMEARRAQTAIPESGATAIPESATALPYSATALPSPETTAKARKLSAVPTAETDDVRGAEAKRKQIEEASFEAAVLVFMDTAPTRRDFAVQYGRGETWGRDRYADAERLMAEDPEFGTRVLAEAERRAGATEPAAVG